jgi:hypothetical protein
MAWFKRKEKELQLLPKTKWMFLRTLVQISHGKIIDADELERNLFVSLKMVFTLELVVVPILKFCFDNSLLN